MALHSSRRAQNHCVIISIDRSNHRFDGGIERSLVSKDSQMTLCLDPSTCRTQELIACSRFKIWSGTARERRYQPPLVGCPLKARELPGSFRTRGDGLWDDLEESTSSKTPLGSKCTLCLKGSLQPIEIATNATALRAHHSPRLLLKSSCFFPNVTRKCYHSVPVRRSHVVRFGCS